MLILGISGSPRHISSSEILLDRVLRSCKDNGADTKKISLSNLDIKPCIGCGGCYKTGKCVLSDSMCILYDAIDKADGLIISSPIYFGSVTGQLKCAIDRCEQFWARKYLLKKKSKFTNGRCGLFIATSELNRRDFFKSALTVVDTLFTTLDIKKVGALFHGGVKNAADILKEKKVLRESDLLGKKLVNCIKRAG